MQLTQEEIKSLIKEIESPENKARKKREFDLATMYEGGIKPFVRSRVIEMYPQNGQFYTHADYNIVAEIVDKKAKSYIEPPQRKITIEGADKEKAAKSLPDPEQQEKPVDQGSNPPAKGMVEGKVAGQDLGEPNDLESKYAQITKEAGLDGAMREFDTIYNRHRHALLAVTLDKKINPDRSETPILGFVALEPFDYDIVFDMNGKPGIVILSYSQADVRAGALDSVQIDPTIAASDASEGKERRFYVVWTETAHYVVMSTQAKTPNGAGDVKNTGIIETLATPGNPQNVNPYGILPFVYAPVSKRKNYPRTNPLRDQAIELNALLSVYLTSGCQQVGQLVLEFPASQAIETVTQGIMNVIKLPQSDNPEHRPTKASYQAPSPNMAGHRESVMTYMSLILKEQGLAVTGKFDGESDFTSGLDRVIANADVQDAITKNQSAFNTVEGDTFKVVRKMLATLKQDPFPEKATCSCEYAQAEVITTTTEQLANIEKADQIGLLLSWEKHVKYNPRLTKEEAIAKEAAIQAEKSAKREKALAENPPPGMDSENEDESDQEAKGNGGPPFNAARGKQDN